jgi:hypothetical protein
MPFHPHTTQGTLPNYDLKEFEDTGLLVKTCSFTPRVVIKEKEGHLAGATGSSGATAGYGQILQVQVTKKALDIEIKADIVPDANGKATGLANAYPGQAATVANFAASFDFDIHGYTRDASKLLMVKEIKRETSSEAIPSVTIPLSYYPEIAA